MNKDCLSISTPSVSIIMPLYNKEGEVERAIQSVFSQTFDNYELIVINDGSTDKGADLVRLCRDVRLRVIDQPNQGVSSARNAGIRTAKADLIAFLDADDEWKEDYLGTILRLSERYPKASVYATNYVYRYKNSHERQTIIRGLPVNFSEGLLRSYFTVASKSDPPIWTSAVAVRKRAIEVIGGFTPGITSGEDLLAWAKLAAQFDIAYTLRVCAIHYSPQHVSDRPGRVPQYPDIVESELVKLLQTSEPSKAEGLKKYLALWHRMRAVTLMHLGEKLKSIDELRKALGYSFEVKLLAFFALSLLPGELMVNVYNLRRLITQKRSRTYK